MKNITWKSWAVCGILLWILLVLGIFIYGRMSTSPERQTPSPPTSYSGSSVPDEPYVGKPIGKKPEEIINLFVVSLNLGELDQVVSLLEPNYLITESKDLKKDFYELVRLWEKGELQKYSVDIPSINYSPLPSKLSITLTNGTKKKYSFELVELINAESSPPAKVWYIQNIRMEPN